MSKSKKPDAEEVVLRLLADDAEEFERMKAEGHLPLCMEYQSLIPAIIDAGVLGRQLDGELKEARDYLTECPVCAESLASSSRALRELQAELDASADEALGPSPELRSERSPDPEPREAKRRGSIARWWDRVDDKRNAVVGVLIALCAGVALVGITAHFAKRCAIERRRDAPRDAGVEAPVVTDAGGNVTAPPLVDPWKKMLDRLGSLEVEQGRAAVALKKHTADVTRALRAGRMSKTALKEMDLAFSLLHSKLTWIGRHLALLPIKLRRLTALHGGQPRAKARLADARRLLGRLIATQDQHRKQFALLQQQWKRYRKRLGR